MEPLLAILARVCMLEEQSFLLSVIEDIFHIDAGDKDSHRDEGDHCQEQLFQFDVLVDSIHKDVIGCRSYQVEKVMKDHSCQHDEI